MEERDRRRGPVQDFGEPEVAEPPRSRGPAPGKIASTALIGNSNPPRWYQPPPGKRTLTMQLPGATVQRKAADGVGGGAAEAEADAAGAQVAQGQSVSSARIVEDHQPALEGQLGRAQFMALVRESVVTAANEALGPTWSAAGCPYIEAWFRRNASTDAASLERMACRYAGLAQPPKSARDYIAPICDRLRAGVTKWRNGGDVSADLAAAGLSSGAAGAVRPPPSAAAMTGAPAGLQAKAAATPADVPAGPAGSPQRILAELGDGLPLDGATASRMGAAFGASFQEVRVHTDETAARLTSEQGALAFTVGSHVAFSPGRYTPGTPEGDALLAHELAHVLQQRGGSDQAPRRKRSAEEESSGAEGEADRGAAGALAYLYRGVRGAAARVQDAAMTGLKLQRCEGKEQVTFDRKDIWSQAVTFAGDPFLVDVYQETDSKFGAARVHVDVTYTGSDDVDQVTRGVGLMAPTKRIPSPDVKVDKSGEWSKVVLDVYGDSSYMVQLSRTTKLLDGWKPQSREHAFVIKGSLDVGDVARDGSTQAIIVKSRDAMPASIADAQEGEGIPGSSGVVVTDKDHASLPVHAAAVAAKRWLDQMLNEPVYGLSRAAAPWAALSKKLDADHAKYAKSKTADPEAAVRLTRMADVLQQVRPMLLALGVGSTKEAYLPDIADEAIALVAGVRKKYESAIAGTYDGDASASLKAADQAFDVLWYRVTSLYLQRGKGADKMIGDANWAAHEVHILRGPTRGAIYWPLLESRLGVPGADAGDSIVDETSRRYLKVKEDFVAGRTGVLAQVEKIVEDAQLVMGLSALLATNEVFHILKHEMDGLVGGAFDAVGRDLTDVAGGYIASFEKIIVGLENQLKAGADLNAIGKAAVSRFQGIVAPQSFKDDVEAIKSRIKWVKAIEVLGKILIIVGVAALTGGVAGAAMGGALQGAGASAAVVAGGKFAAEVVVFTVVSRLGNEAVFGKNETSFGEDLITNALMFGFLKTASAAYGRVFKIFADPKLHKGAFAVGSAVTGMVSLQAFAEVHHKYKTGEFMEGGDRARSIFQNTVLLAALALGGHLSKPLNKRVHDDMLVFTAKHFPGRMAKIGAKVATLKGEVEALKTGDPKAAEKAPELLNRIEEIWNEELSVLSDAAKKEGTKESAKRFEETVKSYVDELAKLDLQLSQAGVEVDLGAGKSGNFFRPISPGFVAFKPQGKEVLEAYHKEHKGTFEKLREDMYSGKIGGEETFYIPEGKVSGFLLETPDVAGLKEADAKRPTAGKDTEAGKFGKDAAGFADAMAAKVGGAKATTVKEVELLSLTADLQVEVGLRVLDPVFGKQGSNAFKAADKAIQAETDAKVRDRSSKELDALQEVRDRIVKEMLDTLRDPSLRIARRKSQLLKLLSEYEGKVKKNGSVRSESIDFAEARKQIEALTAETFENMLTVDGDGNLTQKGKKVGTLRGLMEKVKSINNLYRKNGVPRELALSISTPRERSIPREVKLLSRAPKEVNPPAKKPASPVDPMEGVEGEVVDIGVGLGSYARDVGGETGSVVQTEYGEGYADPAMIRRDLTWENTAPRVDVDSVLVLGDALQTLPMLFSARSVKRLFINNVNAHYSEGGTSYRNLARGLRKVMRTGGRVEVQWTDETETTGGKTSPRGHITGDALARALEASAFDVPRKVDGPTKADPVTEYDYSIEATRTKSGVPGKAPPTNPVPKFRAIFTFGD